MADRRYPDTTAGIRHTSGGLERSRHGRPYRVPRLNHGQSNNDSATTSAMDLSQTTLSGPIHNTALSRATCWSGHLKHGAIPNPETDGATQGSSPAEWRWFLTDHYPDAHKAIWDLRGVHATSRHIRTSGSSAYSTLASSAAPPLRALAEWNRRERLS